MSVQLKYALYKYIYIYIFLSKKDDVSNMNNVQNEWWMYSTFLGMNMNKHTYTCK